VEGHIVDRLLHVHATAITDKHWRHQKGHCTKLLLLHHMESWCKLVVDFDLVVGVTSLNFTKVNSITFYTSGLMLAVKEYQQDPYMIHKIWYLVNATKHTCTLVKQEYS